MSGGGGLNRDGRAYFKLRNDDGISSLHWVLRKELEYKVENLKYKEFYGSRLHAAEDQNQIQTASW